MCAIYNKIGYDYDVTRRVDPEILLTFVELLRLKANGKYLDIACGTGNYTVKFCTAGGNWVAFDQSEVMLAEARKKTRQIQWTKYEVDSMGFNDQEFDGATCSLAIHHFPCLESAFKEVSRVLKQESKLVIFTSTPEQMKGYWLNYYFPNMMKKSYEQMPSIEEVSNSLVLADMEVIEVRAFFIKPELIDFFLYSGKQRPEMYLSKEVRNGISSFQNFCSEEELNSGLEALDSDINSKKIEDIIKDYENYNGDYCFIVAKKLTIG